MATTVSGELVNEYKSIGRGDYGVRVARKGFDAATGADSDLLFNSNWPIIQIVKLISEENKRIYIDETENVPASYIFQYSSDESGCAVDEAYLYLPATTDFYIDPETFVQHAYKKQYRIYHGMGYVPFFFRSDVVSNVSGYYLITNINIRKDVDYPYTSKPSSYDGMSKDYGIKSKSMTRKQLPRYGVRGCGLNTNIQSKMVMAVKTEKSMSKESTGQTLNRVLAAWGLPKDENTQKTMSLYDFECYGFYADSDTRMKFTETPVLVNPPNDMKGGRYQCSVDLPDTPANYKMSLVIIRTPMVAPDYEEFVIE